MWAEKEHDFQRAVQSWSVLPVITKKHFWHYGFSYTELWHKDEDEDEETHRRKCIQNDQSAQLRKNETRMREP